MQLCLGEPQSNKGTMHKSLCCTEVTMRLSDLILWFDNVVIQTLKSNYIILLCEKCWIRVAVLPSLLSLC